MKLDDYRTKYFEDRTVRETLKNGKKKYEYVYTGIWCAWGEDGFRPSRRKVLYVLLEALSILLLALAGTSASALNAQKAVGGCTLLGCIALVAELYGIVNFVIAKEYMTELDCNTMDRCITLGAFLRGTLLILGAVLGIIVSLTRGVLDGSGALAAGEYFLCGGLAFAVYILQHKLSVRKYRNADGEVGSRY